MILERMKVLESDHMAEWLEGDAEEDQKSLLEGQGKGAGHQQDQGTKHLQNNNSVFLLGSI